MEARIKDDMAHELKRSEKQDQSCTEVGRRQRKRAKELEWVQVLVHHVHFCVAQNTRWISPFNSMDFAAPKSYKAWTLLNLQNNVCKSKDLKGLNEKLTSH